MPFELDMRFWITLLSPFRYVYRKLFAMLRSLCASLGFFAVEEARAPLLDCDEGSVYSDPLTNSYSDDADDSASIASVSDAGTIRPNAHHHVDVGYSTSAESSFASLDPDEGGSGVFGCGDVGGPDSTDEEDYVYLNDAVDGFWNF